MVRTRRGKDSSRRSEGDRVRVLRHLSYEIARRDSPHIIPFSKSDRWDGGIVGEELNVWFLPCLSAIEMFDSNANYALRRRVDAN